MQNKASHQTRAHKTCALEIKSISADGTFAGYASVFNLVDSQHDVVRPGAFRTSLKSRTQTREAYALMKAGVVRGLSIGYSVKSAKRNPDTGVRELLAVDLWEISLVTLPANEAAQVTVVKSSAVDSQVAPLFQAMDRAGMALMDLLRP